MGKSLGLIQVAHIIGLCDDLEQAILGCSQQCCLPFPVRLSFSPLTMRVGPGKLRSMAGKLWDASSRVEQYKHFHIVRGCVKWPVELAAGV